MRTGYDLSCFFWFYATIFHLKKILMATNLIKKKHPIESKLWITLVLCIVLLTTCYLSYFLYRSTHFLKQKLILNNAACYILHSIFSHLLFLDLGSLDCCWFLHLVLLQLVHCISLKFHSSTLLKFFPNDVNNVIAINSNILGFPLPKGQNINIKWCLVFRFIPI